MTVVLFNESAGYETAYVFVEAVNIDIDEDVFSLDVDTQNIELFIDTSDMVLGN
jgi:hypothetical protein